jgi:hypothetical protein
VADASSFDPDGDGQENTTMAGLAIDTDKNSRWQTEGYNQNFGPGGIKPGVGLVLDLGRPQEVRKLALTLAPAGGSQVTIYGADERASSLEGWTSLTGDPETVTDRKSFSLQGSHRYLMIWFSSLPQDGTGRYRGGVTSVALTS